MDYILDNLAIGNYEDALNRPEEISGLLCVAEEKDVPDPPPAYHKVFMPDMKPMRPELLKEAVDWVESNIGEHRIMVFCNAGVGRSPSVVVGYLCCVLGYGFGEAVEYVARKRPQMSVLPQLIEAVEKVKRMRRDEA